MKLYEVPRGSMVVVVGESTAPPAAKKAEEGDILTFKSLDGMYSVCYDNYGAVVHLPAWQEVNIV